MGIYYIESHIMFAPRYYRGGDEKMLQMVMEKRHPKEES
jgi:hypothetical protein